MPAAAVSTVKNDANFIYRTLMNYSHSALVSEGDHAIATQLCARNPKLGAMWV